MIIVQEESKAPTLLTEACDLYDIQLLCASYKKVPDIYDVCHSFNIVRSGPWGMNLLLILITWQTGVLHEEGKCGGICPLIR